MSNPYQPPGAPVRSLDLRDRLRSRRFPAYSLACAFLAAALASLVVPNFREAFLDYGADLPLLTRIVFAMPHALWLLPALVLSAWRWLPGPLLGLRVARVIGIGAPLLLGPVIVVALYLPIFKLAATIG